MKNSSRQMVKSVPSCLAYSCEASVNLSAQASVDTMSTSEEYRQVRRSATTIGLAISMGAALLLLNQNDKAVALDSIPSESPLANIPSLGTDDRESAQSQPKNAIAREAQPGESLWQLAQQYRPASGNIAATNQLPTQTSLLVGQTSKISSQDAKANASEPLARSLSKLKESRQQLQESLRELKSEKSEPKLQLDLDFSKIFSNISSDNRPDRSGTTEAPSTVIPQVPVQSLNSEKVNLEETNPTLEAQTAQEELQRDRTIVITRSDAKPQAMPQSVENNDSESLDRPVPLAVSKSATSETVSKEFRQPELPALEQTLPDSEAENTVSVAERVYRVKPGDTLNKIAQHYGVPVSELIRANQIKNPNVINVSQRLTIPTRQTVKKTVVNAQTASRPNVSIPVVTASLTPVSLGTANVVENETQITKDSYTQKLIADIDQLQQDYPSQSPSLSISGQRNNRSTSAPTTTINPEWNGNRQTIQLQNPPQSRAPGARFVRTPIRSNSQNQTQQTQLVGSAPANVQQYNPSVGATVGPDLPALSSPDEYLPNSPMKFTGFIWPAKGVLTSGYGWRWGRMHKGVDIAAPVGTPIVAAADGEVISAGWNSGGYGNLVKIRHADGSETIYAHNSRVLVRSGQFVAQGELIAEMGSTGYSTGPHLHFEVHPNGQSAVNPMAYLPKNRS